MLASVLTAVATFPSEAVAAGARTTDSQLADEGDIA